MLEYYCRSLSSLLLPRGVEAAFGFVNDGSEEQYSILNKLSPAILLQAEQRPADAAYAIGNATHHWNTSTIEHLARQKQRLLQAAIEAGYTHAFLVDSDLLLEPTTLVSLWETKGDIVNGAFWTRWQNGEGQPQPQCWLSHPYGMNGLGMEEHEFIRNLAERRVLRCAGGGACTLIALEAIRKGVRYHPRLPLPEGGMWQGEDRTFAILAQRYHERQLVDGWPDIFHAYHPQQRTAEALEEAWSVLNAPRQEYAKYGDMVNLVLDPMEDAALQQAVAEHPEVRCIRGRLGQVKLAPELEGRLLQMKPGDDALVNVHFPHYHEVPAYRGQQAMIRMRLVDLKPYSFAPVLHEVALAGAEDEHNR